MADDAGPAREEGEGGVRRLSIHVDRQVTDFGDSLSFKARAMIFDRIFKAIAEGRMLWGKEFDDVDGLFDALDTNNDELITTREFCNGMTRLGMGLSVVQIEELVSLLDYNNNGTIEKPEWQQFMAEMKRKIPETRTRVEDMPFCERNLIASVSETRKFNKHLRQVTKRQVREWNAKHKDTPIDPSHRKGALMPYTRFPAGEDVLENFGRPHVYTSGWEFQSRVTALDVPDAKEASAIHVADAMQASSTRLPTDFNVTGVGRPRPKPRKPPCLAQTIVLKDPLERILPTIAPTDKFYLWSYRHKSKAIGALAGHDTSRKGFMTAQRIAWVYTNVLNAPGAEIVATLLKNEPTRDLGRYKGMIDFVAFATKAANSGVRHYNVVRERSVLRQAVNPKLPARLVQDRPSSNAHLKSLQRDLSKSLKQREREKVDLEHRATRELLRKSKFESTTSLTKRESIEKTLLAFSSTKGKGARRALNSAKRRSAQRSGLPAAS